MVDAPPQTAWRAVVAAAALVVVIAGLQIAADILLPILLAVFLSIIATPIQRGLVRLGLPDLVAIPIVVLVLAGGLAGLTGVVAGSVASFSSDIQQYEQPLRDLIRETAIVARQWGVPLDASMVVDALSPNTIMLVVGQTVGAVVGIASRLLIVLVTVTFILLEVSDLVYKLQVAFGSDRQPAGPFTNVSGQVQRYLLIKSVVSAVTGLLAGVWCWALGLDFALIWGVLAFLLNYIPSIGSIVAAIPPILLAVVQLGWPSAIGITAGYLVINISLGNFIEPRLMGRSLGLSPLIVFMSLLFWGWLWGPVGMLFAVPMTVIAKLVLESSDETRWIAVLLGSGREAKREATISAEVNVKRPPRT